MGTGTPKPASDEEAPLRIVSIILGSVLALAFVVLVIGLVGRRDSETTGLGIASRGGQAIPAASSSLAVPTLPALPTPPPPPDLPPVDPDLTNATPGRGISGIRPSRAPADSNQAAFTEEDVRAFITSRSGRFGRVQVAGPYEIRSVIFLRATEALPRLGVTAGATGDQLICAATLHGTFTVPGPYVPGNGSTTNEKSRMILIFDARSGNLLEQIALP